MSWRRISDKRKNSGKKNSSEENNMGGHERIIIKLLLHSLHSHGTMDKRNQQQAL
jgi:hypothetical protein